MCVFFLNYLLLIALLYALMSKYTIKNTFKLVGLYLIGIALLRYIYAYKAMSIFRELLMWGGVLGLNEMPHKKPVN